jgi:hypothetical protein
LQREYLLLKKQAAIDWKAMYADKHTSVTVQSIVEDYVYNAQLTARTQRMFTKIKIIIVVAGVITATSVFAFDLMIWEAAAIALLVCLCVCAWWHARKEKDRQLVEQRSQLLFKVVIHRDEAAKIFMEHCRQEAGKLLAALIPPLRAFCDGKDGRPTLDNVMSRPFLTFDGGQFKNRSTERALIASHCYAITTAIGLDSLHRHIDPFGQADVMEWIVYKLIVEEDVGKENVGTPPSPWQTPERSPSSDGVLSIHVQWAPGTFEHGLPSQQKQLTDRYKRLSARQKVVVLLMALRVYRPHGGVSMVLHQKTDLGGGVVALTRTGTVQPDPDELDEWENDLEITDAGAALSGLPNYVAGPLISAISAVDSFWPTFGKTHRVTWE